MCALPKDPYVFVIASVAVLAVAHVAIAYLRPSLKRQIHQFFRNWTGATIFILGAGVLGFGSWGFGHRQMETGLGTGTRLETVAEAFYQTTQLFFLNIDVKELTGVTELWIVMVLASFLATIIAAKAVLFLFQESWIKMRLATANHHIVICGLGRIGQQLFKDLTDQEDRRLIVIVEPNRRHP
jgi:FlaA1/EpsC-like NDP-sugar epimerase